MIDANQAGTSAYAAATQVTQTIAVGPAPPNGITTGYWLVAGDGGVFSFGDAGFYGSTGSTLLNKPVVEMASTPDGKGYWLVASDWGIFSFGDAGFYGSASALPLNKPVVGIADR